MQDAKCKMKNKLELASISEQQGEVLVIAFCIHHLAFSISSPLA
jgi:hypothetical protein